MEGLLTHQHLHLQAVEMASTTSAMSADVATDPALNGHEASNNPVLRGQVGIVHRWFINVDISFGL